MGNEFRSIREPSGRIQGGDHEVAARATALLPAAGRAAFAPRSRRDQSQRFLGPGQHQSQQRTRSGQLDALGRQPRVRVQRSRVSLQRRSRRRARRCDLAQRHTGPGPSRSHDLGGESVHVELRARVAERRHRRTNEIHVPELLECGRGDVHRPSIAGRSADAWWSNGNEPARRRSQRLGQHRRPEASVPQHQCRDQR